MLTKLLTNTSKQSDKSVTNTLLFKIGNNHSIKSNLCVFIKQYAMFRWSIVIRFYCILRVCLHIFSKLGDTELTVPRDLQKR